ncbi:MAG: hypothetical protein M1376_10860 [Planctomycetes bacterium]|nr:hypothetical protein [Planctomycetota bacterium]
MAILPKHGYRRKHRHSHTCDARAEYMSRRGEYGEQLRPKCPGLVQWLTKIWRFTFPQMPNLKPPIGPMAWRILMVMDELAAMRLDEGMVQVWAQAPELLNLYLEPIQADLKALPVSLKAHGRLEIEAKQCSEAIHELQGAATDYTLSRGRPELVYLMPPKALLWDQIADKPIAQHFQFSFFTEWRKGEILRRREMGLEQEARLFDRMSNTFPVYVVAAARKVAEVVKPILDAFPGDADTLNIERAEREKRLVQEAAERERRAMVEVLRTQRRAEKAVAREKARADQAERERLAAEERAKAEKEAAVQRERDQARQIEERVKTKLKKGNEEAKSPSTASKEPQAWSKTNGWKPPKNYTGAKSAGVPRSTLEYWECKDDVLRGPLHNKVERDPSTKEKYYPDSWLNERKSHYIARKKSS